MTKIVRYSRQCHAGLQQRARSVQKPVCLAADFVQPSMLHIAQGLKYSSTLRCITLPCCLLEGIPTLTRNSAGHSTRLCEGAVDDDQRAS